jgi:uncharacterized protein DUF6894
MTQHQSRQHRDGRRSGQHRREGREATRLLRYFFHVVGGGLPIEDDEGTPFPDPSEAVAHAKIIANDLAQDDDQYRGHALDVMDDEQNLIARIPIARQTN